MRKKDEKVKYFVVKEDVFLAKVNVFIGGTYADYRKKLVEMKIKHPEPAEDWSKRPIYGEVWRNEAYDRYIWIKSKKDMSTIQHETLHLALQILQSKGIPVTYENEEVLAYYSEWWFNKIRTL